MREDRIICDLCGITILKPSFRCNYHTAKLDDIMFGRSIHKDLCSNCFTNLAKWLNVPDEVIKKLND